MTRMSGAEFPCRHGLCLITTSCERCLINAAMELAVVQKQPSLILNPIVLVINPKPHESAIAGNAVLPEHCQCLVKVVPQKETDSLDLQWPIPPEQSLFRSRPCSYLSYLLGCVRLKGLGFRVNPKGSCVSTPVSSCNNLTCQGLQGSPHQPVT